jgi:hypothetical protein
MNTDKHRSGERGRTDKRADVDHSAQIPPAPPADPSPQIPPAPPAEPSPQIPPAPPADPSVSDYPSGSPFPPESRRLARRILRLPTTPPARPAEPSPQIPPACPADPSASDYPSGSPFPPESRRLARRILRLPTTSPACPSPQNPAGPSGGSFGFPLHHRLALPPRIPPAPPADPSASDYITGSPSSRTSQPPARHRIPTLRPVPAGALDRRVIPACPAMLTTSDLAHASGHSRASLTRRVMMGPALHPLSFRAFALSRFRDSNNSAEVALRMASFDARSELDSA